MWLITSLTLKQQIQKNVLPIKGVMNTFIKSTNSIGLIQNKPLMTSLAPGTTCVFIPNQASPNFGVARFNGSVILCHKISLLILIACGYFLSVA